MSKTIVFPKSERSCSASSVGVTVGTLIAEIEAAMLRADGVLILDVVDGIDAGDLGGGGGPQVAPFVILLHNCEARLVGHTRDDGPPGTVRIGRLTGV